MKRTFRADLGCECDANFCHTEKNNQKLSAGEFEEYCHDDQDRGFLVVRCVEGEIEAEVFAAVWSQFNKIDGKILKANEQWAREIPGESSWYDQTNKVRITGRIDSKYNLDFKSWDD